MKAISLWQPWASAIAVGAKRVETRSWPTRYRGPLAIHAAKRCNIDEMIGFHSSWAWTGALWPLKFGMQPGLPKELDHRPCREWLPFGAIVAVCRLVDCRPTGSFTQDELLTPRMPEEGKPDCRYLYAWNERMMGDFTPGRFGWLLEDVRAIEPIPINGKQGFFEVPDSLFK